MYKNSGGIAISCEKYERKSKRVLKKKRILSGFKGQNTEGVMISIKKSIFFVCKRNSYKFASF
jgi:hypothetical protein